MNFNTLKTTLRYLVTLLGKYTPLKIEKKSLDGIYNYIKISEQVSTSGQPTENQFPLIKAADFNTIINLAPHNVENSIADEAATTSALGLRYIHIPVDFQNPSELDFEQFVETMQSMAGEKVWVHCAANMRVSAFIFRYRCEILNEEENTAKQDIAKIWQPFGAWKKFLQNYSF